MNGRIWFGTAGNGSGATGHIPQWTTYRKTAEYSRKPYLITLITERTQNSKK
jgi:hypothetical protein